MRKNFNLPGGWNLRGVFKDPRKAMRVLIGALLLANLAMAAVAFHPFGGSADDLARQRASKAAQLSALDQRLRGTRQLVDKVQVARHAGDEFLGKYFMDRRSSASGILSEVQRIATDSGIGLEMQSYQFDDIEGSDNIKMLSMQVGCEGTYQNLAKFVSLLDKSPRFLIIERIQAAAVQNGQKLNVSFKIDTFTIDRGVAL